MCQRLPNSRSTLLCPGGTPQSADLTAHCPITIEPNGFRDPGTRFLLSPLKKKGLHRGCRDQFPPTKIGVSAAAGLCKSGHPFLPDLGAINFPVQPPHSTGSSCFSWARLHDQELLFTKGGLSSTNSTFNSVLNLSPNFKKSVRPHS